MLISLVNAKAINVADKNTDLMQHKHTTMLSVNKSMDCCSEGVHISCSIVIAINVPVVFSQEVINSMRLPMSVFEASYASFISKILTPPPIV
jgi:hypothetical protein